jgi:hypothetical protein
MRYIKPFNENVDNFEEELRDFCETSLAYLLDEGYDIQVSLRDKVKYPEKQHILVTLGLRAKENTWLQDYDLFFWDDVKDYYIPFLQMLVRRYELLAYPAGYLGFNTKRGVFYLSVEQVINDESQVFDCPMWGINIRILNKI